MINSQRLQYGLLTTEQSRKQTSSQVATPKFISKTLVDVQSAINRVSCEGDSLKSFQRNFQQQTAVSGHVSDIRKDWQAFRQGVRSQLSQTQHDRKQVRLSQASHNQIVAQKSQKQQESANQFTRRISSITAKERNQSPNRLKMFSALDTMEKLQNYGKTSTKLDEMYDKFMARGSQSHQKQDQGKFTSILKPSASDTNLKLHLQDSQAQKTNRIARNASEIHIFMDQSKKIFDDLQPHLKKVAPVPKTRNSKQGSLKHSKTNLSVQFKDITDQRSVNDVEKQQSRQSTSLTSQPTLRQPAVAAMKVNNKETAQAVSEEASQRIQFEDLWRQTEEKIKSLRRQQLAINTSEKMSLQFKSFIVSENLSPKIKQIDSLVTDITGKLVQNQSLRLFNNLQSEAPQRKKRSRSPDFTQSVNLLELQRKDVAIKSDDLIETKGLILKLRQNLAEISKETLVKNKDLAVELSVLQYLIESKLKT